jgi:hypothetical protein
MQVPHCDHAERTHEERTQKEIYITADWLH